MIEEYKYSFHELLTNYPSGLNTQNLLAENAFNISSECILVGNGAAELIKALLPCIPGKIAVNYPTFQEYPACIPDDRLTKLIRTGDFTYSAKQLLEEAEEYDTLILINPDNPSGNYIQQTALVYLIEELHKMGKRIILDESFVDFSSAGASASLLKQEILNRYPNLIVIKSISKSYGVPGIRLGLLACGDKEIVGSVRERLPIWNINSFAEFFLQMLPKYGEVYSEACKRISNVRDRLAVDLATVPYLRVLPSQANYFLCEVHPPMKASQLCEIMLSEHNILLKDCTSKDGFSGKQYIRIAVRDENDNQYLLTKLLSLQS